MGVTFDSSNSGTDWPPNGISFTHSLGQGSGNNRIVVVGITLVGGGSQHSGVSVTYNGVSMTQLSVVNENYFGRWFSQRVFYLLDASLPASSGSYTVSMPAPTSGPYDGGMIASSYYDVEQSAPPYVADSDNGNPLSGAVTTPITLVAASGMMVDSFGIEDAGATAISPGSGQTEREEVARSNLRANLTDEAFASSGSNSMAETPNGNYYSYGHIVLELADVDTSSEGIDYLGSQGYSAMSSTQVTGSYTCHAGSKGKRKLLVAVGGENIGSGFDVNSVTYNSVSLTKINEYDHTTPYNNIAWFYLDEGNFPSTPGSYTIQATFDVTINPGMMAVLEIDGAKQGDVDDDASSQGTTTTSLNTNITTQSDKSWVCGAIITGDMNTFTPQSGQTEREDIQGGGGGSSLAMGHEEIATAGATNMQWGMSTSVNRALQMVLAVAPHAAQDNACMNGTNM